MQADAASTSRIQRNSLAVVDNGEEKAAETAFIRAVNANDFSLVERLLEDTDVDPNLADKDDNTALHTAARQGHARLCRLLIRCGARVNSSNHAGMTPLFLACSVNLKTVRVLLKTGSDVHLRNGLGEVPLHAASSSGLTDVILELVLSGSDVNVRSWQGLTPLYSAISSGSRNAVKTLLQLGAEANQIISSEIPGALLGDSCCRLALGHAVESSNHVRVHVSGQEPRQLSGQCQRGATTKAGGADDLHTRVVLQTEQSHRATQLPSHSSHHTEHQLSQLDFQQSHATRHLLSLPARLRYQAGQGQGRTGDQRGLDSRQHLLPCSRNSTTNTFTDCPAQHLSDHAEIIFKDSGQPLLCQNEKRMWVRVIYDSDHLEAYRREKSLSKADNDSEQSVIYCQQSLPMHASDRGVVSSRQCQHQKNEQGSVTNNSIFGLATHGLQPNLSIPAQLASRESETNLTQTLSQHPTIACCTFGGIAGHQRHPTSRSNAAHLRGPVLHVCTKPSFAGEEERGEARTGEGRGIHDELPGCTDAVDTSAPSAAIPTAPVVHPHTSIANMKTNTFTNTNTNTNDNDNTTTRPTSAAENIRQLVAAGCEGDQPRGSTILLNTMTKEIAPTGYAHISSTEGGEELLAATAAAAEPGDESRGFTALHRSSQLGLELAARELIAFGARVNARTNRGETPLHLAAKFSSTLGGGRGQETTGPLIRLLVRAGADQEARTTAGGETPLHLAALVGDALSASVLISEGADVSARDAYGNTPLHKACERILSPEARRVRTVRVLMTGGARAEEEVNEAGLTPLHVLLSHRDGDGSASSGRASGVDVDVARILLAQHSPNRRTAAGLHPLLMSVHNGLMALSTLLVEKGADPGVVDPDGKTPMHYACAAGNARLFQLLWTKGGNPMALDKRGFSPLRYAVESGSVTTVRTCINTGAASVSILQPLIRKTESPLLPSLNEMAQSSSVSASPFYCAFINLQLDILRVLAFSGSFSFAELDELSSACQAVDRDELSESQRAIVQFILVFSQSPPSLQNLCRWNISHLLGCSSDRPKRARELRLPSVLRKFVLILSNT